METRQLTLDGQPAVTISLPVGTPEETWQEAFGAYLLPPGEQVILTTPPDGGDLQ